MNIKLRLAIGLALFILFNLFLVLSAWRAGLGPFALGGLMAGADGLVAWAIFAWVVDPLSRAFKALDSGISSFEDGEYSFRLAPSPQPEVQTMFDFFNRLGELFHRQNSLSYQKELLLETVVHGAPMAILLFGPTDRVVLANDAARDFFRLGGPLPGTSYTHICEAAPKAFADALESDRDVLFTVRQEDQDRQAYHLSQRHFKLNAIPHRLVIVKRLTRELRRQEVESWKKLIRLINHELNNSLAPISSLLHSTRTILASPSQHHKLEPIFETMDRTIARLVRFIEDYAAFARLPKPNIGEVHWTRFLDELSALYRFTLENRLNVTHGRFDAAQMQQVLFNLLKNAHEAGDPDPVLSLHELPDRAVLIRVTDGGRGMSHEALEKALLPFFSTKRTGTGLGLPLCREVVESHGGTLGLRAREEGGLQVSIRLPQ